MKQLEELSRSSYSWWETWQIFKGYWATVSDEESSNNNILHIVAKSSDLALLKKILNNEEGIDINERDQKGWTALHIAAYLGNLEMTKFLVEEKGADISIKNDKIIRQWI